MYVIFLCVLSSFGVLYILEAINKHAYKILPKVTIDEGNFFDRKLEVKEIHSLKEYIVAKVTIYVRMRRIGNLENDDISDFDLRALEELQQYINIDLKQYINNLMLNPVSKIHKVSSHIECKLKRGKLDFYLSSRNNNSFPDFITIRFESFSKDRPVLEVSNFENSSYTYKIKSKHIRFINPDVKAICDIKEIVNRIGGLNVSQTMQLQVA